MRAIIPAAGIGTRLRPHTHTAPKALLHVAGKPILGHIIDELRAFGIRDLVFVIGFMGEKIVDYVKKNYKINAQFITQEELKGLGGAHKHHFYLRHFGLFQNPFHRGVQVLYRNGKIPADCLPLGAEDDPEKTGQCDGDQFLPGILLQPTEDRSCLGGRHPLREKGLQFDAERRGVCDFTDTFTFRKRDAPPLFGNDDTEGVRALRKAEGSRVPETEVPVPSGVCREGQMASETHDPIAVDKDGAVVSDRVGIENALQQGLAEETIQVVSPGEVAVGRDRRRFGR